MKKKSLVRFYAGGNNHSMPALYVIVLTVLLVVPGCNKLQDKVSPSSPNGLSMDNGNSYKKDGGVQIHPVEHYEQVNLVSDIAGLGASKIDANLANAWGIAEGSTGALWISANHKGLTTIYDKDGNTLRPPVAVPFHGDHNGGSPTGVVFNTTTGFVIPANGQVSKFIYAAEDGTISAWSSGDSTITVADRSSSGTVYKGLTLADNHLYATDFFNGKIDVFDQSFNYVGMSFFDPGIPADFAPFNIQNIGGQLYVTYAKHKGPDNVDDQSGPGNGYIDVFSTSGTFVKRFASQGTFNSPWGLAVNENVDMDVDKDDDHGKNEFDRHDNVGEHSRKTLLVGNFGDGRINVFDFNGNFKGQLADGEHFITIQGLWAITYLSHGTEAERNRLYFTAGPNDEENGLFGYLGKK